MIRGPGELGRCGAATSDRAAFGEPVLEFCGRKAHVLADAQARQPSIAGHLQHGEARDAAEERPSLLGVQERAVEPYAVDARCCKPVVVARSRNGSSHRSYCSTADVCPEDS